MQRALKQYRTPSAGRSIGQLCTSFIPYVGGLVVMGALAQVSYLLSLLLALPTAGFLIRVFIIFHDAGHGSLFRRSRWNRVIGYLAGFSRSRRFGTGPMNMPGTTPPPATSTAATSATCGP